MLDHWLDHGANNTKVGVITTYGPLVILVVPFQFRIFCGLWTLQLSPPLQKYPGNPKFEYLQYLLVIYFSKIKVPDECFDWVVQFFILMLESWWISRILFFLLVWSPFFFSLFSITRKNPLCLPINSFISLVSFLFIAMLAPIDLC